MATALDRAARNGHLEIARLLLLQSRADVDRVTSAGRTALHLAAKNGHLEVARLLLQREDGGGDGRGHQGTQDTGEKRSGAMHSGERKDQLNN